VKILVTSTPGLGHVIPLVPLAQAFARQGHEVRWATGADAGPTITAAGVPFTAAGLTGVERHTAYRTRYPEWATLQPQELPAHMFPRLFGEISLPATLDAVLPIARDWSPDLLVHEVGEFAAPIMAGVLGVPHVTQGFGARLRAERFTAIDAVVGPYWRDHGLEPRPGCGSYDHLYLDIYPPSLDPGFHDEIAACQPLRPVTIDEPGVKELSEWLAREDESPLVYLTFGTIFNVTEGAFGAAVEALRALDVRALITVGPGGDVDAFGPLPERITVAHYVPQHLTLAHADLVVSHAGSGTFLATLGRGIPQLCLPQAADQFNNATAGATSGAAIQLSPQDADPERVKAAIEALLREATYVESARRVAADIAAMPSPDEVAAIITARF
jgi:UDP:flavonoid glycosyltransferase YjiC (YdhE family)